MSQVYKLVVPELREYHDFDLTIGQMFRDDATDFLGYLLTIPVDSPTKERVKTVVSTNALMQQHRALVRQAYGLPPQNDVSTKPIVKCQVHNTTPKANSDSKTRMLTGPNSQNEGIPNTTVSDRGKNEASTITRSKPRAICTCFEAHVEAFSAEQFESLQSPIVKLANERLPEELVFEIFKHVEIQGLVTEGLADPNICGIARFVLENRFKEQMGAWAGKSIVCWGPNADLSDFHEGAVSNTMNGEFSVDVGGNLIDGLKPSIENCKEKSANHNSTPPATTAYSDWIQPGGFHMPRVFQPGWSGNDVDFITSLGGHQIKLKESRFYPTDQPWIFRNHTTREFFHADAVALGPKSLRCAPFMKRIGFGEVLLYRTIWSTKYGELDGDNAPDSNHHRGIWSGHAFDITTVSHHEKEIKIKQEIWTNISDVVHEEIWDVFRRKRIFWDD